MVAQAATGRFRTHSAWVEAREGVDTQGVKDGLVDIVLHDGSAGGERRVKLLPEEVAAFARQARGVAHKVAGGS